jgi:alkaline phosphatase D
VFFETSYGDVDFLVIDDRYYRDNPGVAGGSILGEEQHAWLEAALLRSTATFRIIASGSIFSRGGGETWLDYPDSRARLFSFIRTNDIRGVVFLAGDIHRSHFRLIHRTHYDIPELVSSGLAVNPEGTCPGPDAAEPDAAPLFCTQAAPTFMQLDIDTTRLDPRIIARIIDGAGAELGTMTILRSRLR